MNNTDLTPTETLDEIEERLAAYFEAEPAALSVTVDRPNGWAIIGRTTRLTWVPISYGEAERDRMVELVGRIEIRRREEAH